MYIYIYAHQIPCGKDRDGGTFGEHHWDSPKIICIQKFNGVFYSNLT